jgi:acyl carrier protein
MIEAVRQILRSALQLSDASSPLAADSALLGAIPELDSMAVVTILTLIEERFGIEIADDDISADAFATVGSLTRFVEARVG